MTKAKKDWSEDPGFKRFARHVLKDTVPKISVSAYVMTIAPEGGTRDIKQAVEIGLCILMDKPLIVFKQNGRVVAERLLRIADHVIEGDMNTPEGREALSARLQAVMRQ